MARNAVSDVVDIIADMIADVIGGPVTHNDIDPGAWIGGAIAEGFVPPTTP
jgi:hypothetical protein